ncbi:MAG: HPr family phosphocarrier protein [Phycisphaerae bacterium]|nr:HPr family phosphocarrier protein [Phycisphaerae bacterium]
MALNPSDKIVKEVQVLIEEGLHMRPAMQLVECANKYDSSVSLSNGKTEVDGKSIMQVTMLAATKGTMLTLSASGSDAHQQVEALALIIEDKVK